MLEYSHHDHKTKADPTKPYFLRHTKHQKKKNHRDRVTYRGLRNVTDGSLLDHVADEEAVGRDGESKRNDQASRRSNERTCAINTTKEEPRVCFVSLLWQGAPDVNRYEPSSTERRGGCVGDPI